MSVLKHSLKVNTLLKFFFSTVALVYFLRHCFKSRLSLSLQYNSWASFQLPLERPRTLSANPDCKQHLNKYQIYQVWTTEMRGNFITLTSWDSKGRTSPTPTHSAGERRQKQSRVSQEVDFLQTLDLWASCSRIVKNKHVKSMIVSLYQRKLRQWYKFLLAVWSF